MFDHTFSSSTVVIAVSILFLGGCGGGSVDETAGVEPTAVDVVVSSEPKNGPVPTGTEGVETAETVGDEANSNLEEDSAPPEDQPETMFGSRDSDVSCVPGIYDIEDDDLDRWFTQFLGVNGGEAEFVFEPGSGGTFEFFDDGSFIQPMVIIGQISMDGAPPADIELSGVVEGWWAATPNELAIQRDSAQIDGTVTVSGMEISVGEFANIPVDYPETTAPYECYDSSEGGLLSIQWPTGDGTPAPILDLQRRT